MKYKKMLKYACIATVGYGLMFAIMWLGGKDFVRGGALAAAFSLGTICTCTLAVLFEDKGEL